MSKKPLCPVCKEPTDLKDSWCHKCRGEYPHGNPRSMCGEAAEWGAEQARKAERRKAKEKR